MRFLRTSADPREVIEQALTGRNEAGDERVEAAVRAIIDDVRRQGDAALLTYTRRFDWALADRLELPRAELETASKSLPRGDWELLRRAAANIREFHDAERGRLQSWMQTREGEPGRIVGQTVQAVRRAGVYVPGGHAAYPSTVLMACIPARAAGVKEIVLCSPPDSDGRLAPLVAAAAAEYADRVFTVGGAQAIAAMAYGTETVPRCDIIVGPGNAYVNAAKRLVYGAAGIDMLAGPSEVAVVADESANAEWAAADILAQTEHGGDNRAVVLSSSASFLEDLRAELERQRPTLSRGAILQESSRNIVLIETQSLAESLALSDIMAPEHLQLVVDDPFACLGEIRCAGAILIGPHTSAPDGDYWAGPSHTLPTAGAARYSSPLSAATFLKRTSIIYTSAAAARASAGSIARFATHEGFDGHAQAARLRAGEEPV